ncbi:hypothetical protein EN828_03940 [Mesorhizobium sp. M2D.F.Ca.ET.185.01.1.1]|uniref:hypothetical protein n=1 Tax=unclassified Mesorhizobium TaxID=325217 RepID=UPI000FCB8711|nr:MULTISPECIES: hypothetical protein [unclassified Mesorhizobium]TGP75483.1 hypothetical protein EN870_24790 [bacterium M00.F.Ca.ET.227.01.1.1]TGP90361.1 hypothetical protein EN865_24195 [bacterium M00.F.Ca.ET.222.01.1.1]TGP96507.1 hypothetical protein EN864_08455 [bacterium M00.F.Ca.ET.221.01.1.1]TGT67429.1 hypothetical protein EN802_29455 [bacterium M00.F.Ca.ET.159.01.1.1]TGT79937.1 hypothetical protein EN800_29340 [bacterium M00.F.Ca.ET.157.01.1.1]TGU02591.1 hypothetical protein EN806_447
MKTASRILQILALSACFAAQMDGVITMPGVRQAMRTMDGATVQTVFPADAAAETVKTVAA